MYTWRQCWSAEQWLQAHPNCLALWRVPGITLPMSLHYDVMHSKYLGSDSYLQGSILEYLVSHKLPGSPGANLQVVWTGIVEGYDALQSPSRYGSLSLTMFQSQGAPFPCLKGKASEVKHLLGPLLQVCRRHLSPEIHIEKVMMVALENSIAIDTCLDENRSVPRFQGETSLWSPGFLVSDAEVALTLKCKISVKSTWGELKLGGAAYWCLLANPCWGSKVKPYSSFARPWTSITCASWSWGFTYTLHVVL